MSERTITLRQRLTRKNKRRIAWLMYVFALSVIKGDPDETATWRGALRRLGCGVAVFYQPGGTPGEYAPTSEDPRYNAVVAYNVAYGRGTRARVLAHEFGHHLLNGWVSSEIYGAAVVCSYNDDPSDVRHQIARLFERMMLRG